MYIEYFMDCTDSWIVSYAALFSIRFEPEDGVFITSCLPLSHFSSPCRTIDCYSIKGKVIRYQTEFEFPIHTTLEKKNSDPEKLKKLKTISGFSRKTQVVRSLEKCSSTTFLCKKVGM